MLVHAKYLWYVLRIFNHSILNKKRLNVAIVVIFNFESTIQNKTIISISIDKKIFVLKFFW